MKLKILVIALVVILGLPAVALGSSFTASLIQGKTPSEAVQILAEQIDSILGRVENLETQQAQTNEDVTEAQLEIERLRLENENLKLQNENTKTQTSDLANKQECDRLFKTIPDKRGYDNWGVTNDIVSLYKRAELLLGQNPAPDSETNMKLVRTVFNEVKPLYENYLLKCGE